MGEFIELKCLSDEALCVAERDLIRFKSLPKQRADVVHDLLGPLGTARLVKVRHDGRDWLADAKIGTLYDPVTTRCATSVELKFQMQ